MCWSPEASIAMTGAGLAAAVVTYRRGDPPPIWLTLGYFTAMEALQVWGYAVLDQCGQPSNQAVTLLSYVHIVLQPFFINAFAMELVPTTVKRRVKLWVYGTCALSAIVMVLQVLPVEAWGACRPGSPLCAETLCTVSGDWHIAWNIPYNGLLLRIEDLFGVNSGFPTYMVTAFVLPLVYGAWRFVLVHAIAGPILASALTSNPNEMPAIWCLFSIAILLISLSPLVRRVMTTSTWWGLMTDQPG